MNNRTHPDAARAATLIPPRPRAATSPAEGRRWARSTVPTLVHLIDTVELLLTEMITNAVRYGGGASVARLITVASGHGVRVVVCDGEEAEPVLWFGGCRSPRSYARMSALACTVRQDGTEGDAPRSTDRRFRSDVLRWSAANRASV